MMTRRCVRERTTAKKYKTCPCGEATAKDETDRRAEDRRAEDRRRKERRTKTERTKNEDRKNKERRSEQQGKEQRRTKRQQTQKNGKIAQRGWITACRLLSLLEATAEIASVAPSQLSAQHTVLARKILLRTLSHRACLSP